MSQVGFCRAASRFVISLSTGWFLGFSLSVAAESPPASPARSELRTIADATRGVRQKVDTPPTGASPGDLFVFDQPLLDADGKKELGVNSGYCITTLPGVRSQCQWTLSLPTGTVTVAGQEAEKGPSILPIIGATGEFAHYRGELQTYPNGNGTFTQIVRFRSGP